MSVNRRRQPIIGLMVVWAMLVVAALISPSLFPSHDPADIVTRQTARVAVLFWGLAAAMLLLKASRNNNGATQTASPLLRFGFRRQPPFALILYAIRSKAIARWLWTLGCAAFVVHVATAFDQVHRWSHTAAFEHVDSVSGFGPGIFVSYAFTLLWIVDAAWWWVRPAQYDRRPRWLDWSVHGFMAFVVLNGTVVYETGFIRWAGGVLFAVLAAMLVCRGWNR